MEGAQSPLIRTCVTRLLASSSVSQPTAAPHATQTIHQRSPTAATRIRLIVNSGPGSGNHDGQSEGNDHSQVELLHFNKPSLLNRGNSAGLSIKVRSFRSRSAKASRRSKIRSHAWEKPSDVLIIA